MPSSAGGTTAQANTRPPHRTLNMAMVPYEARVSVASITPSAYWREAEQRRATIIEPGAMALSARHHHDGTSHLKLTMAARNIEHFNSTPLIVTLTGTCHKREAVPLLRAP